MSLSKQMSENDNNLQIVHNASTSKDLVVFSRSGFTMPAGNCPPEQVERMFKEWLLHQRREKWIGICEKLLTIASFVAALWVFNFLKSGIWKVVEKFAPYIFK